ncbi:hypothetical protein MS3_00006646 [Schistosoma haematobium]|uniref:Uncharacterized protein n=1 Tax=Schistosoma haematobium TaxID=6185 RepID=A0A922IRF1_SCHHA|nr:hypothetical protein MS3_00006646 [Schistosoma haematobium]KAH9585378.1 hypothetical protein MS3_00006646 [Schistosoma haematobium]CAH8517834.1 unnamed protein product [Schistosoma haematobium]
MRLQPAVLLIVFWYALRALENSMKMISVDSKSYNLYKWEYIGFQESIISHLSFVEKTTNFLRQLAEHYTIPRKCILDNEFMRYWNVSNLPWTYDKYLTTSINSILLRWHEVADECYLAAKDKTIIPLCTIQFNREFLCGDESIKNFSHNLIGKAKLFPLTGNVSVDTMLIEIIILSNCGNHDIAIQKSHSIIKYFPSLPAYRLLYAEVLSRNSSPNSLSQALKEITFAVQIEGSSTLYREKKLSLLLRLGYLKEAREEAGKIEEILDRSSLRSCHLQRHNCSNGFKYSSQSLVAWRPWFFLGLFHLTSGSLSVAAEDFTIAFNLASITLSTEKQLSESIMGLLMYMKALSQHYTSKLQDAMEYSVSGTRNYPFIMDTTLLLAQGAARTSLYYNALSILSISLRLVNIVDDGNNKPSSVEYIETFADSKLVKHQVLQLRALVNYRLGDIIQANTDAKFCLELSPLDGLCAYIKTLCALCTGSLISAMKSSTPVLSYNFKQDLQNSSEIFHLKYLREWIRYTHNHLYQSLNEFHWLIDLPEVFVHGWVKGVPTETVESQITQPGIISTTSNLVMSPDLMKMILNDNSSQFSNQSTNGIECNQKSFILTSQPVYCQKIYLIQLKNYLCNLSNQIGVLISYGDLRSNQAVNSIVTNPRHQLALAIGTIYSAELIRNSWCCQRRVSFNTCWAYPQDFQYYQQKSFTKFPFFSKNYVDQLVNNCNSLFSSSNNYNKNTTFQPINYLLFKRLCKLINQQNIEKSYSPDWFVHASITARLLQLTDPYEKLVFWKTYESDKYNIHANNHRQHSLNSRNDEDDEDPDGPMSSHSYHSSSYYVNKEKNHFGQQNNIWENGVVWDEKFFIKNGQIYNEYIKYLQQSINMILLLIKEQLQHHSKHLNVDENNFEVNYLLMAYEFDQCYSDYDNHLLNQTVQHCLKPTFDKLWHYAQLAHLTDDKLQVFMNIYVPGTMNPKDDGILLMPLSPQSRPIKRHLGVVLKFVKHLTDENYSLSLLYISSPQHHNELISELDSAFKNYLLHGEKALTDILASSSVKGKVFGSSSFSHKEHLQNAIQSTFDWLYYWSILKPISSEYSFVIGYSMTLGMLRALGLEPVAALPKHGVNLELESIFIGSPTQFGNLCREVLGLVELPKSSISLSWKVSPEEIIQSPKHVLEFMNLQLVSHCVK